MICLASKCSLYQTGLQNAFEEHVQKKKDEKQTCYQIVISHTKQIKSEFLNTLPKNYGLKTSVQFVVENLCQPISNKLSQTNLNCHALLMTV